MEMPEGKIVMETKCTGRKNRTNRLNLKPNHFIKTLTQRLLWPGIAAIVLSLLSVPIFSLQVNAAPESANIDQCRNGSAGSPADCAGGAWVNGNVGMSNAHYVEGYSIPYRVILENLVPGDSYTLQIAWDILRSGKNAIDYITHFQRLNDPLHSAIFGHGPELVDPTDTVSGISLGSSPDDTFPIPEPSSGASGQPGMSFNALDPGEKDMSCWNCTFPMDALFYVSEGDLSSGNDQLETVMAIEFTADASTVLLAWGGHIASELDWGMGNSAGDISGSPYHTRLVTLIVAGEEKSIGNQDLSLSADAVMVPDPCEGNTCNDGDVCNGEETCDPETGECVAGTPLSCDDGDFCNGTETCDPTNGCQEGTPPQCNDGDVCNGEETCSSRLGCIAGTPLVCSDGNVCNGEETCDPKSGCQDGTPLVCNDGDVCNGEETCDAEAGCQDGTPLVCNDGNVCNGEETCDPEGGCQDGTPLVCDDENACNGVETCDPESGCTNPPDVVCDDGRACSADSCNPANGECVFDLGGCTCDTDADCDDGNECTFPDTCVDSPDGSFCVTTPQTGDFDDDGFVECLDGLAQTPEEGSRETLALHGDGATCSLSKRSYKSSAGLLPVMLLGFLALSLPGGLRLSRVRQRKK